MSEVGADSWVLGVDACSAGWVGVVLGAGGSSAHVAATIGELVAMASTDAVLEIIGIDIPIGLADSGPRRADLDARAVAGPRRASVFMTPVRATLELTDHRQASELNRQCAGYGISRQAFNLLAKIRQVDDWLTHAACRVVEVHPELSFAAMAGAPLSVSKSTWAGVHRRMRLLVDNAIVLADDLGAAGERAGIDDVLDAAAVAWSARRVLTGRARRLPTEPEVFSDGVDCAIWT